MQNKVINVVSAVVNIIILPSFLFYAWLEKSVITIFIILDNANARAPGILIDDKPNTAF